MIASVTLHRSDVHRVARGLASAATAILLALAVGLAARHLLDAASRPDWLDGRDFHLYRLAADRWLAGGPFYEPDQLAGAYAITHGAVLYPPVSLLLFAPFTILPAILWWLLPLAVAGWIVIEARPSRTGWILIALCVAWPATIVKLSTGNPVLWIVAAMALGVRFGWPSVLVLVKPTLAPFAVVGVRRASWWMALGCLALCSLPFGSMWMDWVATITNAKDAGVIYSISEIPMVAIPILADLTRTAPRRELAQPPRPTLRTPSWRRIGPKAELEPPLG